MKFNQRLGGLMGKGLNFSLLDSCRFLMGDKHVLIKGLYFPLLSTLLSPSLKGVQVHIDKKPLMELTNPRIKTNICPLFLCV